MTKARELSELANLMSASGTTATVAGTLAATTLTGNGAGITGLYADSNVASYLAANAASNIAAEAVNEAKLQVSNSPTNGYMLTAQSAATGGMTWAEAGGGYWETIAEVTLGTSVVSAIDISLPTGFDAHKIDIVFPMNSAYGNKVMYYQIVDSSNSLQAGCYLTSVQYVIANHGWHSGNGTTTTNFYFNDATNHAATDFHFASIDIWDANSTTRNTVWKHENTAMNPQYYNHPILTRGSGRQVTAATTSKFRFYYSGASFANDTSQVCYYRIYGHAA